MSPEQARGQSVDKRSDIWAFGCVLYEMLTGRLAFPGETVSDTIAGILEREPDWSALPATTPAAIRRLLRRCLVKDPKQRLRDIGDVKTEIDAADRGTAVRNRDATGLAAVGSDRGRCGGCRRMGGSGALRPRPKTRSQRAVSRSSRTGKARKGSPRSRPTASSWRLSPIATASSDLWLTQVGTGNFVNLTADLPPMPIPSADSLLRTFGFSGDGGEIWFSTTGDPGGPKLIMPLTGGAKRPFLGRGTPRRPGRLTGRASRISTIETAIRSLSPTAQDATRASFSHAETANLQDWFAQTQSRLVADGEWIYFVHGVDPTVKMEVWRIRASGGSPEQLTQQNAKLNFLAPLNPRTLLYVAQPAGPVGPVVVESGHSHISDAPRQLGPRAVHVGVGQPGRPAHRRHVGESQRGAMERAAARRPGRGSRRAAISAADDAAALAPRFGGTSLFYSVSPGDRRRALAVPGR